MPFRLGAANQPRSALMFTKPEPVSWRENCPNRGLILGVIAMTVLMSATAVSALFLLPRMGQSAADAAQEAQQVAASQVKEKITAIVAEPTGRKGRLASQSLLVSDAAAAEATDMPLAADPRWAAVVAAGATQPLEAMPEIPGADKIIAKDPSGTGALALADTKATTNPASNAAVKAIEAEVKTDADAAQGPRQATIKRSVNMRAKPEKGGAVMRVIPAKSAVELVSCTQWCEVVFEGQRGYIFKSYVQ
ncbi:SH3 domain-containing protein [Aminobacter sp. Piv2-1]|uniref:SH3 domain-containing protein n=1 Tax=Aminobacter sp. Piv2-1 TaxID=3031122 RepID=UPI0030EEFE01